MLNVYKCVQMDSMLLIATIMLFDYSCMGNRHVGFYQNTYKGKIRGKAAKVLRCVETKEKS